MNIGFASDANVLQPTEVLNLLCYNFGFASNSPAIMLFGVPGLKRAQVVVVVLATLIMVSCGTASPPGGATTSGLKFRALVGQSVSSGFTTGSLIIVNAEKDILAPVFGIGAQGGGVGRSPMLMAVTPNKRLTLSYSSGDNILALVSNSQEQPSGTVTLPGAIESMVVSTDSASAYVAIPTTSVFGQPPGELQVVSLGSGAATARVPIPAVRFLAQSHNGNRLLGFSDNSDNVSVIVPSDIGTVTPPVTKVGGFDRPVGALFSSDDTTAYVLNCGAECGGGSASIQALNMTTNPPSLDSTKIPVPAATIGFLDGSRLYVAGTPPGTACTTGAASLCGTLSVVDLAGGTVLSTSEITDGYHNRIDMGADGQLFLGARTCSNVLAPSTDQRGCLSIFNTSTSTVVIPAFNGDVTGIQAITNRHVVYVAQGGELKIYDTRTDDLQVTQVDIFGAASDVKLIDF
jgi:hypothetical protein